MDQSITPGANQDMVVRPVATAERIKSIDAIRGFALRRCGLGRLARADPAACPDGARRSRAGPGESQGVSVPLGALSPAPPAEAQKHRSRVPDSAPA